MDNIFTYISPIITCLNFGWSFATTIFGYFSIALIGLVTGMLVFGYFRKLLSNFM